jgi:uncharacterized protein YjiS (DUF1127 family)
VRDHAIESNVGRDALLPASRLARAHLARFARRLAELVRAAAQRHDVRMGQRQAARALWMRDDRLLADIGLRRDQLELGLRAGVARSVDTAM